MATVRFSKKFVVQELQGYVDSKPYLPGYRTSDDDQHEEHEVLMHSGKVAVSASLLAEVKECKKFSKAAFEEMIQARIDQVQEEHGFDPHDGYAQVRERSGGEQMWKDYGRFYTLRCIAENTGVVVRSQGRGFSPDFSRRSSHSVTIYTRWPDVWVR